MEDAVLEATGVALVTGGGGDLGRATALRLARNGAAIALLDASLSDAESALADVEAMGGRGLALEGDVTSRDALQHCLDEIEAKLGDVDVLVNGAGIEGAVAPIGDYPRHVFDRVMAVNATGVFLAMQLTLPRMIARGRGSIVNVASTSAIRGRGGMAGYVASKHAVLGLTRVAALDVAGTGVRVNAVLPGPVEGRMIERIEQQMAKMIVQHSKRISQSEMKEYSEDPGEKLPVKQCRKTKMRSVPNIITIKASDGRRFLTRPEASEYLCLSPGAFRNIYITGKIRTYRLRKTHLSSAAYLFLLRDLEYVEIEINAGRPLMVLK